MSGDQAREMLAAVRKAIGDGPRALQVPPMTEADFDAVRQTAATEPFGFGAEATFEAELRRVTGAKHAIAVASGTAALHLALVACGIGSGDEVLLPALTFIATANAVVHAGAVPHFVDARQRDLGIAPFKLRQYLGNLSPEKLARIKAIVPVHLLGNSCAINEIGDLCDAHGITVIEDAAEALGSRSPTGKHCGRDGKAGILSFNLNKIATTGGGGAVLTDSDEIERNVRHLATNAKVDHPFRWDHDAVGFNYRMNKLGAALGTGQLRRLPETLAKKRALALRYEAAFFDTQSAQLVSESGSNKWLNALLLDPRHLDARDDVIMALRSAGYEARALFTPLHTLPMFASCPRQPSLLCAEDIFRRAVCLPSTVEANR